MNVRTAVRDDLQQIRQLIYSNVGHGPYLDHCLDHFNDNDSFTLVYEENGKILSFIISRSGADISRTDFDGYDRLNALIDGRTVSTGYLLVVDKEYANQKIGHKMIAALFERLKHDGVELFFCECIVPPESNNNYLNGKLHWLPREFDVKNLFYQYYPEYFSFTTSSDEDYCINCNGICHCGAAIFLGEL